MPKQEYVCDLCQCKKLRYSSTVRGTKFFCSPKCKSLFQKTLNGDKNPNFGKKWTDDKKEKQSSLVKSKVNDNYRHNVGKANRDKKLSTEHKNKISIATKGKKKGPKSDYTKKLIGAGSKAKWTLEYKIKHRSKMESIGRWLPLDQKEDCEIYFKESNWISFMFDIVSLELFKKYGVWHCKNNKIGLVRDHKYSRKSGFINKVFPEILRHPANCNLISHSENVRMAQMGMDDLITIEELFEAIQCYNGNWKEHEICLQLITDYLSGKRWTNKHKKGAV